MEGTFLFISFACETEAGNANKGKQNGVGCRVLTRFLINALRSEPDVQYGLP